MACACRVCGYVLAVGSAWSFAWALVTRAHVRIDTLYLMLPRRLRPVLDLLALVTLGFVASGLGLLVRQDWWRPTTVASAVFSARERFGLGTSFARKCKGFGCSGVQNERF